MIYQNRLLYWACPTLAGVNRVPTRTSALPRHLSPAGGGESAIADLGVEFFRLDFGVWLAPHSVPSRHGGFPGHLCYVARRGRPLCLPFFNAAAGTDFHSAATRPTESTPDRFAATPARGGHKNANRHTRRLV